MPKPLQLTSLDAEEQWLCSELPPDAPHPISKAEPSHRASTSHSLWMQSHNTWNQWQEVTMEEKLKCRTFTQETRVHTLTGTVSLILYIIHAVVRSVAFSLLNMY